MSHNLKHLLKYLYLDSMALHSRFLTLFSLKCVIRTIQLSTRVLYHKEAKSQLLASKNRVNLYTTFTYVACSSRSNMTSNSVSDGRSVNVQR